MSENSPSTNKAVYLSDYQPPTFRVNRTGLEFELDPVSTVVRSRLELERNRDGALTLYGDGLELRALKLDGESLGSDQYTLAEGTLVIANAPDKLTLETESLINPEANTALNGLYRSGGIFCTQCEPEGFRRITWFPDRPDVLSIYTVGITANREQNPVLLANGNRIEYELLDNGLHRALWHDPWPKPSYLFALVGGDLGCLRDTFTTRSGRQVQLEIYSEHHNMDQCGHAMESLKKSMSWDEQVYGREYDLDTYMIVAVDDFNMGAMENKGLNIFNSKYVLARPETATDADFDGIEGVIGHEYFHNWSGNRVTCRDWFQLSLKEGFTVFRDQEFSADMGSRGVKRIIDANLLRAHQFPEDNGPLAHPVRPDSYVEINNFYTMTVYNKGAEVVRMLYNLLGVDTFRQGCDLYFDRHDGEAVTTDDFLQAHEDAGNRRLEQFRRWYSQAGTPRVTTTTKYDATRRICHIHMTQSCPPTPGQEHKQTFHIPVRTALFSRQGEPIRSRIAPDRDATLEHVFELTEAGQTFTLYDVESAPVTSLLRGFSAPVKLDAGLDDFELTVLMAHDSDPFNRWDAGQRLALAQILKAVCALREGEEVSFDNAYLDAFGRLLEADLADRAFHAFALKMPEYSIIAEELPQIDPLLVHRARSLLESELANRYHDALLDRYREFVPEPSYQFNPGQSGRRALKNQLLHYLAAADLKTADSLCLEQYRRADNMTDTMAALNTLCEFGSPGAPELLETFYRQWKQHSLIVDKWLRLQAMSPKLGDLSRIRMLLTHAAYNSSNPNKVRALLGAFCHANPVQFHQPDGSAYAFLTDQILALDPSNPQITSRLAGVFNQWQRYAEPWQGLMRQSLERIRLCDSLSRDTREIVTRALAGTDTNGE